MSEPYKGWGTGKGRGQRDEEEEEETYLDMHFGVFSPQAPPDTLLVPEPLPPVRRSRFPDRRPDLVEGQDGERHAVAPVGREAPLARADGAHRVLDLRELPGLLELERGRELLGGQREAEREADDVGARVRVRAAAGPERDLLVGEVDLLFEGDFVLVDPSAGMSMMRSMCDYGALCNFGADGVDVRVS